MLTGYVIFVFFTAVGITSYFRYKIKYRIFYVFHHIVFITYIITIMHTIDNVERRNGGRSQTFKWFSATILLYACDRAAMYLNHRYFSTVTSASAIDSTDPTGKGKLVILKVKKPSLFHFCPGQYVYLKVPGVDNRWHPYSIGSGPESKSLDFYIKVYEENSWSGRLFQMIHDQQESTSENEEAWDAGLSLTDRDAPGDLEFQTFKVEILGPYGCSLGSKTEYTRAIVIGTGTGFVPCMSALQEHTNQCLALDPTKYEKGLKNTKTLMGKMENKLSSVRNLSMVSVNDSELAAITRISQIIYNANKARMKLILHVMFMFAPAFGLLMLGFTLSWNTVSFGSIHKYIGMKMFLVVGTIAFQVVFLLTVIRSLKSSTRNAFAFLDLVFVILSAVADWFWFSKQLWGSFDFQALVFYSLLVFYMFMRLWIESLEEVVYNPVKDSNDRRSVTVVYEKFCFVWSSRSAEFIAQVYPDILETWEELAHIWGPEKAMEMCEIRIHCTDPNIDACQQLVDELQTTSLFQQGAIKFGRPGIQDLVEKNTSEVMDCPTRTASRTLLAFCGSSAIGRKVKELKVMNDIFLLMSGNALHGMDVVIQTYGVSSTVDNSKNMLQATRHPFSVVPNEDYFYKGPTDDKKDSVFNDDKSVLFDNAYDRLALKLPFRKRMKTVGIGPVTELFLEKKGEPSVRSEIQIADDSPENDDHHSSSSA